MAASPFFVSFLFLLAGAAAALAVSMAVVERRERQGALAKLETYEWSDERQRQLAESWQTRLLRPVLERSMGSIRRLTPADWREKATKKLTAAGMSGEDHVDRFLAMRVAGLVALPIALIAIISAFGTTTMGLAIAGFATLLFVMGPTTTVTRKAEARQAAIAKSLPDVLDLLVISVEAGLGFEQAVERTVTSVPGPLTEEFARMLGEVRAGARRSDAMRALAARIDNEDVRGFVLAVLQADTFGVSIGRMLRNQADEIRVRRRQQAQEKAQKAPVKMLIPMVFCIFPAIFVVIIGPAVINIMHTLT